MCHVFKMHVIHRKEIITIYTLFEFKYIYICYNILTAKKLD